jgi:uncharacterized protein (DUF302 family)
MAGSWSERSSIMVRYYALKLAAGTQFEDAVREAKTAILDHGFGVVADIDIAATLKEKTGRDIGAYRILGACKPATAEQALRLEPAIGVLLPCNVVVRQNGEEVEVITADPLSLGGFAGNSALEALGLSIGEQMQSILESVAGAAHSNAGWFTPPAWRTAHRCERQAGRALQVNFAAARRLDRPVSQDRKSRCRYGRSGASPPAYRPE